MFRDVGYVADTPSAAADLTLLSLEIYFKDSRSLLIVFLEKSKRQAITDKLSFSIATRTGDGLAPGLLKSPLVTRFSAKVSARVSATLLGFRIDEISTAQRKWQAREISNVRVLQFQARTTDLNVPAVHLPQRPQPNIGEDTE